MLETSYKEEQNWELNKLIKTSILWVDFDADYGLNKQNGGNVIHIFERYHINVFQENKSM